MKQIISAFFIWRLFLFVIAGISPVFIPEFGARFPYYEERLINTGLPHFIWSFGNFDGVHYLGIAKNFYSDQYTQAFFPLYPLLIKAFSYITFNLFEEKHRLLISALLISNLAFLTALIIFYKLISETYNKNIANWSSLFLLTFPASFFFGSIYTEGLFLLLIIASFYLALHQKILLASVVGAFSSATRIVGLFLALFLVNVKKKSYLPIFIVPVGFLLYVLYLGLKFNNPFYFLTAQSVFGQERETTSLVLLPQVIYRYLKIIFTTQGLPLANAIIELSSVIFALTLLLISYKKVKREWALFSFVAILIPTLTGTFASMPRYILIAFPIYIVLAQIKNTKIKILILSLSSLLLAIFTSLFTQGYWVA